MAYSPVVTEHFLNPRNVGTMESPDAVGEAGNPSGGEFVVLHLRVCDGQVEEARFQTFGCGPAIAACSVLTEWVKGKSADEAGNLTPEKLIDMLGGLPEDKFFCAQLAVSALKQALRNCA